MGFLNIYIVGKKITVHLNHFSWIYSILVKTSKTSRGQKIKKYKKQDGKHRRLTRDKSKHWTAAPFASAASDWSISINNGSAFLVSYNNIQQ